MVELSKEFLKAVAQRTAWLDQQGVPPDVADVVIRDVKTMCGSMNRDAIKYHLLAMALLLGIRAEHQVAALILDAYRHIERTPPPTRKKG